MARSFLHSISPNSGEAVKEWERDRAVEGNVVLVHGLGGTALGTWTNSDGKLWPGWLAQSMPSIGFWTLDWNAPTTRWWWSKIKWSLPDEALGAMNRLISRGLDQAPLCLVGHSMGGLLIKEILHQGKGSASESRADLVDAIRTVVFFGTPHSGAVLADLFSPLPFAARAIKYLRRNNDQLIGLSTWFEERATANRPEGLAIDVHSYAETQPLRGLAQVVSRVSAMPHAGGVPTALQGNHFGIIQPDGPEHDTVLALRRIIVDSLLGRSREEEARLGKLAALYPFPTAAEVDTKMIGIERSAYVADADPASLGSYIERDQEQAILNHLRTGRAVHLRGPSSAGKTRAALEIMSRFYGGAQLVLPARPGDAVELVRLLTGKQNPQGAAGGDHHKPGEAASGGVTHVLWLDDLDRYAAAGLNATDVHRFLARPEHMVVATLRSSRFSDIRQATDERADDARELVRVLPTVRLSADFSTKEAQQAGAAYAGADLTGGFLSFSAVEEMRNRLEDVGVTDCPEGHALVWSVTDWQRIGLRAIRDDELRTLFPLYLPRVTAKTSTDELYADAKRWALEPVRRKGEELSRVTLLRRSPETPDAYDVHDSLEDFLDERGDRPILDAAWKVAEEFLAERGAALTPLGYVAAVTRGMIAIGERVWRKGVELGEGSAAFNLGLLLEQQGRVKEAEAAWRKGAELGDVSAATNLGGLLEEQGRVKEAEAAYCEGIELGDGRAAGNLGLLLSQLDRPKEAEAAYGKGIELGDGSAATNLGILLEEENRPGEAEAAWRKGVELGNGNAAFNLGLLLERQDRVKDAESVWRAAVEQGHGLSAGGLGTLLDKQGRPKEAEAAFGRGVELGEGTSANNLGVLLARLDRPKEAEAAFARGVELGEGLAASNLGKLLVRLERLNEAEFAYDKGVELGNGEAAFNLGVLLEQQERPEEAEEAWRKGVELGDGNAAFNLGVLLEQSDRLDEAKWAYRKGVELGESGADPGAASERSTGEPEDPDAPASTR